MRAAILVFPGVEELDFAGPFEVFAAAAKQGAPLSITIVSTEPDTTVTAFHGLSFAATRTLCSAEHYDLLVIPGGGWLAGGDTGVRRAAKNPQVLEHLCKSAAAGTVLASVCTGAFLLAEAGLLQGRVASTHHSAAAGLAQYGAIFSTARVVDTGNVLSAGGVTAGIDLALWLVERFFGKEPAKQLETYLEYRRTGEVLVKR